MGWLTGAWICRKSKHIDGSASGDQENYQMHGLVLHRASGTDDDTNVYIPYCQPDFKDVRFTTDDGETLLPFYLSGSGDSRSAVVKVASIPSDGADVYIYYGNAEAENISSGADTFELFDDFTTDNFIDVGTPYVYVDTEDERLEGRGYRAGDERCYRDIGVQGNTWRMDFDHYAGLKSGTYGGQLILGLWDTLENFAGYSGDLLSLNYHWTGSNYGSALCSVDAGSETNTTLNLPDPENTYYVTLIRKSATSVWMGVFTDAQRTTHVTGSPVTQSIGASIDGLRYLQASNADRGNYPAQYIDAWFDNLSLSKYVDPEPAWSTTGDQEVRSKKFKGARIGHNFAGLKVPTLWTPKAFKTSGGRLPPPDPWLSLREHRTSTYWEFAAMEWVYHESPPNSYLDMNRTYQGTGGHVFFVANTGYLDGKKVWIDWRDPSGVWWDDVYFLAYDGGYDRTSDTDFPDGNPLAAKGSGLLQEIVHKTEGFSRQQDEWLCDFSYAQESQVTITAFRAMEHNVDVHLYIYGMQIRDAEDNVLVNFAIGPVTMEREETYGDYGYTGTLT